MAQSEPSTTGFQLMQIEIDKINKSDNQVQWWQAVHKFSKMSGDHVPHCLNSDCTVHLAQHCISVRNTNISRPPLPIVRIHNFQSMIS